jgi:hypothetical protein
MVNYGDLQFAERIMVARRSEMSAEWKVRFAICIASVAIQAFTKLLFSFSDVYIYIVFARIRKLKTLSPNGINEKK